MKIKEILQEAKFAKEKTYYFHGTGAAYLKSILKHGLIPNKQEGGYGSEEDDNEFGVPLTPLAGVYMTTDFKHAKTAAQELSYKTESDPIILVIKGQSRSNFIDEDFISGALHSRIKHLVEEYFIEKNYELEEEDYEQLIKNITNESFNLLMVKFFGSIVKYKSVGINTQLKEKIMQALEEYCSLLVEAHEYQVNISNIKLAQDRLTKILRTLNYSSQTSKSVRHPNTIGFSGATKIVGVINLNNLLGWGETGGATIRYKVNHPLQVLQN